MCDLNCWNQRSQQEPEVQEMLCELLAKLVRWALAREKVPFCTVKLNTISEQVITRCRSTTLATVKQIDSDMFLSGIEREH